MRSRRKMGHVTFLAQDRDIARERAEQLQRRLSTRSAITTLLDRPTPAFGCLLSAAFDFVTF
jgi:hypothetical protein